MYTVYIIYSKKIDKYYIGFSSDVTDRLRRHNSKSKGFTFAGRPWVLVHSETFLIKKEAAAREKQLNNRENRNRPITLILSGHSNQKFHDSGL